MLHGPLKDHEYELRLEQCWVYCLLRAFARCSSRCGCQQLDSAKQLGILRLSGSLYWILDHFRNPMVLVGEEAPWTQATEGRQLFDFWLQANLLRS